MSIALFFSNASGIDERTGISLLRRGQAAIYRYRSCRGPTSATVRRRPQCSLWCQGHAPGRSVSSRWKSELPEGWKSVRSCGPCSPACAACQAHSCTVFRWLFAALVVWYASGDAGI